MKVESFLPVFPGFYNTIFEAPDYDINDEEEDFEPDYKGYETRVSKACTNAVEKRLKDLGFINSIRYQSLHSPREYNFANDAVYVEYLFTRQQLGKIKQALMDESGNFQQFLKENYTSCSGFISSHSNNINDWMDDLLDQHKFGAVLGFLLSVDGYDSEELYYDVSGEMYL